MVSNELEVGHCHADEEVNGKIGLIYVQHRGVDLGK